MMRHNLFENIWESGKDKLPSTTYSYDKGIY